LDAPSRKRGKGNGLSDETFTEIREKREAKGKDKNRYQEPFFNIVIHILQIT